MGDLAAWALALMLFVAFTIAWLREPRSMLPAVSLLLAVQTAAFAALGDALRAASRWGDELAAAWVLVGLLIVAVLTVATLGVFLVVNAVTMIRKEGVTPAVLASFALGAVVVTYVGLTLVALFEGVNDLAIWLLLIGLPLTYLGWMFTAFVAYSLLYGWAASRWGGPVDAVVVLGAGLAGGERVTALLASRLDQGRRVYARSRAAGRSTIIVVSGGQGEDERVSEAEAMRRHLLESGVEPSHVHCEDRSRTTEQNLAFSSALLRDLQVNGRVAVVTSNYHAFRAATLMRKAGITGYAVGARTARYFWPSAMVREYVALLRDHAVLHGAVLTVLCAPTAMRLAAELTTSIT